MKNKNKKQNKTLIDCIIEYNKIKWRPPKQNGISFIFLWSIFGLLKPHNKPNNQNNNFNNYKNY